MCGMSLLDPQKEGDSDNLSFRRARTTEQIAQRQEEIINACGVLFEKGGYEAVSFTAISEMTTIARQGFYRYYSTKEEILLDLLKREIANWQDDLLRQIEEIDTMTKDEFSEFLANVFFEHPKMLKLHSLLFNVLENNCSVEKLADFKSEVADYQSPIVRGVEKYFPGASKENTLLFARACLAIVLGFCSLLNVSEKQIEAGILAEHTYYDPEGLNLSEYYQKGIALLMSSLEEGKSTP